MYDALQCDLQLALDFEHMTSIMRMLKLIITVYKLTRQKNVWTRAYLIPERNRTRRRQEEGKNSVYLFVFCMNLGEINALLTFPAVR